MPGLTDEQRYKLMDIISRNLNSLIRTMEWSQSRFARETDIGEAALSFYLRGRNGGRIPPTDYLMGLVTNEQFKARGLTLSLDLLTSEKFNPQALIHNRNNVPSVTRQEIKHGDFLGNYLCYFFDQSKEAYNEDCRASRELRYGVVSVFDEYETLTGEVRVKAIAAFFKEENDEAAFELKKKLDSIFSTEGININTRNSSITDAFKNDDVYSYEGEVKFSDRHCFINVESDAFGDNALIILYSPQKKADSEYIGGLGAVSSVTRGRTHQPAAQKIILSKYRIDSDRQRIAEHLNMPLKLVEHQEQQEQAVALCELCKKLFVDRNYAQHFDEADKLALIKGRLNQLVKNYIYKNICCVASVTEEEDKAVFKLIYNSKE